MAFSVNDIVQSIASKVHYKVLSGPSASTDYYLEALEDAPDPSQNNISKGDMIYLPENSLILVNQWQPNQLPAQPMAGIPTYGQGMAVYLIGPEDKNNGYGTNPTMNQYLDDGKQYQINKVELNTNTNEFYYLITGYWYREFNISIYNLSHITRAAVAASAQYASDPIPEEQTEETDPFGLIAQRRSLRNFIGDI